MHFKKKNLQKGILRIYDIDYSLISYNIVELIIFDDIKSPEIPSLNKLSVGARENVIARYNKWSN
jgi:hypothetical protein